MATVTVSEGPYIHNYAPTVGDTLSRTITFYEGDPLALADITGDTFSLVLENEKEGTLVQELTLGSGIEFEGDNTIRWTFTDVDTASWTQDQPMRYAIVRTKANGTVRTITAGRFLPKKFKKN